MTANGRRIIVEVCLRRLRGRTTLTRDEMRLAGNAEDDWRHPQRTWLPHAAG